MSEEYIIPARLPIYLRRLALDYEQQKNFQYKRIIDSARVEAREATAYDNWDNGITGHDVVLYLGPEHIVLVPLSEQDDIADTIRADLNKAARSATSEYINDVHFELMDDNDPRAQQATEIGKESIQVDDVGLWLDDHLRVFISHRDTHKQIAHDLKDALRRMGISCFVAHETIEPDAEWQKEIERALKSMEVMIALITEGFSQSTWTNQELGFALGRNIPVIGVKVSGEDPPGFISSRQALKIPKAHVDQRDYTKTGQRILEMISARLGLTARLKKAAISSFGTSNSFAMAEENLKRLEKFKHLDADDVACIVRYFNSNNQLQGCFYVNRDGALVRYLNEASDQSFEIKDDFLVEATDPTTSGTDIDDEIPF